MSLILVYISSNRFLRIDILVKSKNYAHLLRRCFVSLNFHSGKIYFAFAKHCSVVQ